ncbi:MAG: response regulator [Gammaproteobacteria bacterium]
MVNDSCKVLVVDDNHDAADTSVMLLHSWKHEAVAVYSAAECITIARQFDPDIVLMDIGLPGMNGIDVAKELQAICPGVRIIGVSGFTQKDIVRRSRAAGFTDYLVKPVAPTELKDAVDTQCSISRDTYP